MAYKRVSRGKVAKATATRSRRRTRYTAAEQKAYRAGKRAAARVNPARRVRSSAPKKRGPARRSRAVPTQRRNNFYY